MPCRRRRSVFYWLAVGIWWEPIKFVGRTFRRLIHH